MNSVVLRPRAARSGGPKPQGRDGHPRSDRPDEPGDDGVGMEKGMQGLPGRR